MVFAILKQALILPTHGLLLKINGSASTLAAMERLDENGEESLSGSSPASTGPAGARFEGQVGAHYLLTMLAHSEPRGLPGTTIDRIEFQRGEDGYPLDDVVIHAHENTTGRLATLQIQVKRSIKFSPGDGVFEKVARQIATAMRKPEFWTGRNELAIAAARGSHKIDGAYQDVLRWARQLGSAQSFFDRLHRSGTGNADMRTFVETMRNHLRDARGPYDDETVWKVLARLQILIFDYTAVGSAAEELSRERAVRVLPPKDAANASSLWSILTDLAEEIAADGGDRDHERLSADLVGKSICLAADRRLTDVRAAVAEASSQALADIDDRIGTTSLARTERVEAVNDALGRGRYVEIRGDAGVGKSGVLKHFAELFGAEGRVLVLSPARTPPRGWMAMRSVLEFKGTARDLLGELAADGGSALFIDNLDSFSDEQRRTVNDLVRAAAEAPGILVVATARRNFGVDEPSWLDPDAVKALGTAPPVMIEELSEAEIGELKENEPSLAGLLDDIHPAREVVRNLYRLSRLAGHPARVVTPTTELDMAEQWWNSAGGERNDSHRERARLLRALAEVALGGAFVLDVRGESPTPIDALVKCETLRDLGNDRVTFRHDVLRQWAIGNLLAGDAAAFEKLPLDKPASAVLARGIELAARFALERKADDNRWAAILERLSRDGVHSSWRRAAILAIVHSETANTLLDREATRLLDNDAVLLRELIRTVIAVDVEPASQLLVRFGVEPATLPAGIFVPTSTSWLQLIIWLLKLGTKLPAQALGDVAELYTSWMLGTFGHGQLTPNLVAWLHAWLVELEEDGTPGAPPRTYSGRFSYREGGGPTNKIRTGFLSFCNKRSDLAVDYVNRVRTYKHGRNIISSIMKFRGTLAQAAPKELAALTAEQLIANDREDRSTYRRRGREEPFQFLDHEFLPASPAQGPFLELLTHAPDEGLALIRRLLEHAIQFGAGERDPGHDGFLILFEDGERFFPWTGTYRWSRGESNYYGLGSGLMAMEAWAHQRIDAGEDFDTVLKDVLGPRNASAAIVLIAIDLIISHWPKSKAAAIPFLGCPELVSLDRARLMYDQTERPDRDGLAALQKEPIGAATRESLSRRLSRHVPLERLIEVYGALGPESLRIKLEGLLQSASRRLGMPETDSDFADPRFMAQHELNLINPKNWVERESKCADGTTETSLVYVPPESEATHVAALKAKSATRLESANVRAALLLAIDDASRSTQELAAQGVVWAQAQTSASDNADDDDENLLNSKGVLAAALVAVRDGSDDLRLEHGAWAEKILVDALSEPRDVAHEVRAGLIFNPVATAFAGIAELYRLGPTPVRLRILLEIAARESPAGAHGFVVAASDLASLDERIPKAIMRCAFAAAVQPARFWNDSGEEATRRSALCAARAAKAVEDELAWLDGSSMEPAWPRFEAKEIRPVRRRRRRGIRIAGSASQSENGSQEYAAHLDMYVDERAAALWIGALRPLLDVSKRPWLRELAMAYADFSASLNGQGLEPEEELSESPSEWNANYYPLFARTLVGLSEAEINRVLSRITGLPDQSFFDVTTEFLPAVDLVYFNYRSLETEAPRIRQHIINRLKVSPRWMRLVGTRTNSIEMHLGPAVGVIFFNNYVLTRTSSYLTPVAIERLGPFLPQLIDLLDSSQCYFVALVTINLLEVSPEPSLLPLLVAGGRSWVRSYSDDTVFWVEYGIGRRVCAWIDRVRGSSPGALSAGAPERQDIDAILSALVRLGVPEARQVEAALSSL
ncbi:NACHT domain-containing protein [Microvirga lotononidis]|uniref:ATP-binding protein n=1 Tax=Microvirga lotononidis TaxID=864069 RepID=UPI0012B596FD|nr:ATP-binding protein [Microvirga lotononidis]WQO27871.1 ATP-binding protein [Microvirga lotononidis]